MLKLFLDDTSVDGLKAWLNNYLWEFGKPPRGYKVKYWLESQSGTIRVIANLWVRDNAAEYGAKPYYDNHEVMRFDCLPVGNRLQVTITPTRDNVLQATVQPLLSLLGVAWPETDPAISEYLRESLKRLGGPLHDETPALVKMAKQKGRYRLTPADIKHRKEIVKEANKLKTPDKTWIQVAYELDMPERTLRYWRHNY